MLSLRWIIRAILLAIALSSSLSCAPLTLLKQPALVLPARPTLVECPKSSGVEGTVRRSPGGLTEVVLTIEEAKRLREFLTSLQSCGATNEILLRGHIEKLENRLKALSGPGPN